MPEAVLRKLVAEMVAEQIERVAEIAVQRALSATAHRQRIVHDLTLVSDLPLPTRIAKALQRMKIKTVAQLTAMHEEEILLSPNLGERSLHQLKHVLGLYGRSLSGETGSSRRIS
jgi:DNA-directed RNA polymerase alpha subunit